MTISTTSILKDRRGLQLLTFYKLMKEEIIKSEEILSPLITDESDSGTFAAEESRGGNCNHCPTFPPLPWRAISFPGEIVQMNPWNITRVIARLLALLRRLNIIAEHFQINQKISNDRNK